MRASANIFRLSKGPYSPTILYTPVLDRRRGKVSFRSGRVSATTVPKRNGELQKESPSFTEFPFMSQSFKFCLRQKIRFIFLRVRDLEDCGRALTLQTIPAFAWMHCGKPRQSCHDRWYRGKDSKSAPSQCMSKMPQLHQAARCGYSVHPSYTIYQRSIF